MDLPHLFAGAILVTTEERCLLSLLEEDAIGDRYGENISLESDRSSIYGRMKVSGSAIMTALPVVISIRSVRWEVGQKRVRGIIMKFNTASPRDYL